MFTMTDVLTTPKIPLLTTRNLLSVVYCVGLWLAACGLWPRAADCRLGGVVFGGGEQCSGATKRTLNQGLTFAVVILVGSFTWVLVPSLRLRWHWVNFKTFYIISIASPKLKNL